jgi:hypothetical protein
MTEINRLLNYLDEHPEWQPHGDPDFHQWQGWKNGDRHVFYLDGEIYLELLRHDIDNAYYGWNSYTNTTNVCAHETDIADYSLPRYIAYLRCVKLLNHGKET